MKIDDCPKFLLPRLRLFLSADIVGSTALKQGRFQKRSSSGGAKQGTSWFPVIQGFYIAAKQTFQNEWGERLRSSGLHTDHFGDPPEFWKTIGDEVLFTKILSDSRQVAETLRCWKRTLENLRFFVGKLDSRLDVKSTAWLAGFPLQNKEVVIGSVDEIDPGEEGDYYVTSGILLNSYHENGYESKVTIDYIGPSIDTGFRLASHSTSRRLIVSADVAYILSRTNAPPGREFERVSLYYSGSTSLKGVFGGVDYPLFWIDNGHGKLPKAEDRLTKLMSCDREDVEAYCNAYYEANSAYTFRPFIYNKTEQDLRDLPEDYEDVLQKLVANFRLSTEPAPADAAESPAPNDFETTKSQVLDDLGSSEGEIS